MNQKNLNYRGTEIETREIVSIVLWKHCFDGEKKEFFTLIFTYSFQSVCP